MHSWSNLLSVLLFYDFDYNNYFSKHLFHPCANETWRAVGGLSVGRRRRRGAWWRRRVSGQRVGVERQLELGGAEHEQFRPGVLDQQSLVDERQSDERRQVLDPLDGHEEKSRRRLTNQLGAVGWDRWRQRTC